jgi:murein DD-endopeptidase MepM/ murein hydrolase activator NlpD
MALLAACGPSRLSQPTSTSKPAPNNIFDEFLRADFNPADGFDFPFGNEDGKGSYLDKATGQTHQGWYIATNFGENYRFGIHTGEDWNGNGGGNTDLGQEVYAVGNGRVTAAGAYGQPWGNMIVIDHIFYENNERKSIRSVYAHLQHINVRVGQEVKRRQLIGTIGQDPDKTFGAHLHLELRWDSSLSPTYWPSSNGKDIGWVKEHYTQPTSFINQHRSLPVPQAEPMLVLVDPRSYKMRIYQKQKLLGEYDVSFGQNPGPKQVEGDNKTPTGMYFVTLKHKGKFDGPYAAYYGGHWIKVNYPNAFDASRGVTEGIISSAQQNEITTKWAKRQPTLETTRLGGGIGFHGWIKEWQNDGPRHLSFGCVVMHLSDIRTLFDQIPAGTMVVIF